MKGLWAHHPESDSFFHIRESDWYEGLEAGDADLSLCCLLGDCLEGTEKELAKLLRKRGFASKQIQEILEQTEFPTIKQKEKTMARTSKKSKARQSLRDRVRANAEKKRAEKAGSNSTVTLPDDVKYLELKKGTKHLDIIPYEVQVNNHPVVDAGELWYERTYHIHRNIGSENKTVVCPLKTFKKPCPICEHRSELLKDWDTNEEQIKALKTSERQLFNIIDLDKESEGIKVLDVSSYCFGEAIEKEIEEGEDEWAGFPDLEGGYTLKIRFCEEAIGKNSFAKADRVDFKERDDYEESILDDAVDLDACLNVMDHKSLETLFLELDTVDEEEEEEEEESRPARGRGRKSKKSDPDPEPEEEEQEEEQEEEKPKSRSRSRRKKSEDEEKPKSRSRRASRKSEPEEEEPEEEQEEEGEPEEEEKPKSRSRRRSKAKPEPEPEEEEEREEEGDCPGGGTFGTDCDTLDFCNECDIWESCMDEKELQDKKGSRRR